ncbi:cache domain-containing protein [Oryzomonas sagensis]|nr:cache domain-containing protein [Oryzomonas sagensis]
MQKYFDATTSAVRKQDGFIYRLISGTLFINIFVYAIFGYSLSTSQLHYNRLAEIATQNMAKALDTNLCDIFDKIDIGLSAVGFESEKQIARNGINKESLNAYIAKQIHQLPGLYGIRVTDIQGNLLYGTDIPDGKPINVSDRDYFRQLRENSHQKHAVSKLIQGRISGKWNLTIAKRINNPDGSFAGIVLGMFDVNYFDKLFSQIDIGKNGAMGIRDPDFKLVALQPKGEEPGSQIGSDVISKKTRDMIRANPITATYKTVFARDKKERMVTFRKATNYSFYVFSTIAPSDYLSAWRKELIIALILAICFTLTTVTSAYMMLKSNVTTLLHAEAQRYGEEMRQQNEELIAAMLRIKRLEGIISICSHCKKIRTEQQNWEQLEKYITEHSDAMFSHGVCPECAKAHYGISV